MLSDILLSNKLFGKFYYKQKGKFIYFFLTDFSFRRIEIEESQNVKRLKPWNFSNVYLLKLFFKQNNWPLNRLIFTFQMSSLLIFFYLNWTELNWEEKKKCKENRPFSIIHFSIKNMEWISLFMIYLNSIKYLSN